MIVDSNTQPRHRVIIHVINRKQIRVRPPLRRHRGPQVAQQDVLRVPRHVQDAVRPRPDVRHVRPPLRERPDGVVYLGVRRRAERLQLGELVGGELAVPARVGVGACAGQAGAVDECFGPGSDWGEGRGGRAGRVAGGGPVGVGGCCVVAVGYPTR